MGGDRFRVMVQLICPIFPLCQRPFPTHNWVRRGNTQLPKPRGVGRSGRGEGRGERAEREEWAGREDREYWEECAEWEWAGWREERAEWQDELNHNPEPIASQSPHAPSAASNAAFRTPNWVRRGNTKLPKPRRAGRVENLESTRHSVYQLAPTPGRPFPFARNFLSDLRILFHARNFFLRALMFRFVRKAPR